MSFMQQQIAINSPKVNIFNYSGLSSVIFKNILYVFYNGLGNDGVWYLTFNQNTNMWSGPLSCRDHGAAHMNIAKFTSPASVVFNGSLWLFYNGSGQNGTFWTKTDDGKWWTTIASVSESMGKKDETFASNTSPSATVFNDILYLIWNNSASTGLRYSYLTKTAGGAFGSPKDVGARGLGALPETSSAAVAFGDSLYVFFNGVAHDGTFVAKLTQDTWSPVVPVTGPLGGNFLEKTSPAAYVSDDKQQMTLLWNGNGDDGIWYTATQDGSRWEKQVSLRNAIGGMAMMSRSSPAGINYNGIPYMFWAGLEGRVWLSQGLTFPVDGHSDLRPIFQALQAGNNFTITSNDGETIQYLLKTFNPGPNPLPGPSASAGVSNGQQKIVQDDNWATLVNDFLGSGRSTVNSTTVLIFSLMVQGIWQEYELALNLGGENGLRMSFANHMQPRKEKVSE
ncbi:hypothetical protein FBEOM_6448 [Fusarium beomiforme]|uniref:Uncharacterized protein n=1 Tax=Fusarium beomiforme TaxID=44412 RepID=A0A9P5AJ19_9HYPO|nr:hypothetical protein FBEOM_6448 [Fusarium beomiforme]